ncbi:dihydrolipoamide acetyltransferase family protein [Aggregatilineales bacterium SYSU G02658]
METPIIMPQLGESVVEGTVAEWLKQPGDLVEEYESIVRVSTDKVDTEIPSPARGVLRQILVPEGTTVNAGVTLAVIAAEGAAPEPPAAAPVIAPAAAPTPALSSAAAGSPHITPVVARMAREHQLDLSRINGTGRDGRITKKDVEAYLQQQAAPADLPPWEQPGSGDLFKSTSDYELKPASPPPPPAAKPAPPPPPAEQPTPPPPPAAAVPVSEGLPHEIVAITAMRRRIAQHMVDSKRTSPHVTTVFEVDLTPVVAHRERERQALEAQGVRLTLTAYFVTAIARGLERYPLLNARWTEDGILAYKVINVGIATATDDGLIVPVLKNAQDYNLIGLARQIEGLVKRARSGQLKPDDVAGGTFTLTNHGVSGSLFATPIINQPQVAILGVGAVEKRVKVRDDAIAIRSCAYFSLTFDHRIADGAYADGFMSVVKSTLENWR